MTERKIPAPIVNPETQHFWHAAEKGQLLVMRCRGCGEAHYYPRSLCPFCFSDQTEWEEASGAGTIYSFSIIRQASPPYVLAYVTLKEGPTILTNILSERPEQLQIGDAVAVTFVPSQGGAPIPMFGAGAASASS
jgi:uncharacterized OB-fold protein